MKILNALILTFLFVFASCAALEDQNRSPAAKRAQKNFLQKQEPHRHHVQRYDRGDR